MSAIQNTRKGIWLMLATTVVFAVQDALSRYLAGSYNVWMVVMVRYWFFALFVTGLVMASPIGLRKALRPAAPVLQTLRGLLLASEICVMVSGFVILGLVQSHAAFASYPLLVAALSGPILGERVGWRRWTAIFIGFVGVMIILRPGMGVFTPAALIPIAAATLFALYGLLTRYVAAKDDALVSFFWTGMVGMVAMTLVGMWHWQPLARADWGFMLALSLCGVLSHWLLIRAYEVAEASAIQPFAYVQLIWASMLGIWIFGEVVAPQIVIGGALIVASGLFTLIRQRQVAAQKDEV